MTNEIVQFPVLPLRDLAVFPNMVIPLFVGRSKSIRALELAMSQNKKVFLVAQKNPAMEELAENDLFMVGTVGVILQLLKLPDNTVKILVEGEYRAHLKKLTIADDCLFADVVPLMATEGEARKTEVLSRSALALFEQYVKLNKKIPIEVLSLLSSVEQKDRLIDLMASHVMLKLPDKQNLLEEKETSARFQLLIDALRNEIAILQLERKINTRVKKQMEKTQQEYFLHEKMRAVQKEIEEIENVPNEFDTLFDKIKKTGMSEEAKQKAETELSRLRLMPTMSAEATVSRNYLDYLLGVPWKKTSKISRDLNKAERVLNEEHYGLEKVKEHILEYLAVQNRVQKMKGPILCLVGPPGVGKTSLGQSIAKATGREFVRVSLGGVRDEAEIRGHRRTYIGALPGKIIQRLTKVGVKNPLFLLDEVDKLGMDFRGDPASALLEVLDPEQNHSFNDHFLEVDYDLSDVMFVTTANTLDIPPALKDRMEIIQLAGYTEDEKIHIAEKHLLPKLLSLNGLKPKEFKIDREAICDIIRYYTREAGVRNLERALSKIARKVVRKILTKKGKAYVVRAKDLEDYLGVYRYRFGVAEKKDQIGQVTGLAWTEMGGDLLTIEAAIVPGKGKTMITGQLGEVMQESVKAAITVVRHRAKQFQIPEKFFEKHDIHVHVPEGAIPKDGPSAGIAMCTALLSAITKIAVHAYVAMTGEITLRGEVLPIGGLKEKLLAARRGGITDVIIPEENIKDLKEIANNIKEKLKIHPVRWIDDVFKISLHKVPGAKKRTKKRNTR